MLFQHQCHLWLNGDGGTAAHAKALEAGPGARMSPQPSRCCRHCQRGVRHSHVPVPVVLQVRERFGVGFLPLPGAKDRKLLLEMCFIKSLLLLV